MSKIDRFRRLKTMCRNVRVCSLLILRQQDTGWYIHIIYIIIYRQVNFGRLTPMKTEFCSKPKKSDQINCEHCRSFKIIRFHLDPKCLKIGWHWNRKCASVTNSILHADLLGLLQCKQQCMHIFFASNNIIRILPRAFICFIFHDSIQSVVGRKQHNG